MTTSQLVTSTITTLLDDALKTGNISLDEFDTYSVQIIELQDDLASLFAMVQDLLDF